MLKNCILEQLGIITAIGLDKGEEEREVFGSFVTYKFSQQLSNESTPFTHMEGQLEMLITKLFQKQQNSWLQDN